MEETIIRPQEGKQTQFLSSSADIVIYGGQAGGGKTWSLLVEPLRHISNPRFGAVIFRRTYKQIKEEGGMWDEAETIYSPFGAVPERGAMRYLFPLGARVSFRHLQNENTKYNYKGAQIPLIGFDQLEDFTDGQFFYLLSRNRSTSGVRPYVRATCNPDAESWLATFLEWWIDQETGYPLPERSGIVRFMVRIQNQIHWFDTYEEAKSIGHDVRPKSVTFIPASVYDNKILLEKDPDYIANLQAMHLVDMERLLRGNWKIKYEAGKLFNRAWVEVLTAAPVGGAVALYWDFASTKKELVKTGRSKGNDPDFTAGVMIQYFNGIYYVVYCVAFQEDPAETQRRFVNISKQFAAHYKSLGVPFKVRWEVEGGSAAKRDNARLAQLLTGLDARGVRPQGDKILRGKPLAVQAQAGNVKIIQADWTELWLHHMHHQPDLPHDDIWDGSVGAFESHILGGWAR